VSDLDRHRPRKEGEASGLCLQRAPTKKSIRNFFVDLPMFFFRSELFSGWHNQHRTMGASENFVGNTADQRA
jgi:hypothetical protein